MERLEENDFVRFHRAVSRVVAHLAGSDPLDVWPSYEIFEGDTDILVDVLGVLEDNAKPFLEMRERTLENRRRAKAPAASSVVPEAPGDVGDVTLTEKV